jgi:Ketopantoate hydroxymethyltransferase
MAVAAVAARARIPTVAARHLAPLTHTVSGHLRHAFPSSPALRPTLPVSTAVLSSTIVTQQRYSSHSPLGREPDKPIKKISLPTLAKMHAKGDPITMVTAHDFPSGLVADHAGIEMVLVGDSLAMVALGMQDTSEVLLEEMLLHCRSVSRAVKGAVTVCKIPLLCLHVACIILCRKRSLVSLTIFCIDLFIRSATCLWVAMKSRLSKHLRPPSDSLRRGV